MDPDTRGQPSSQDTGGSVGLDELAVRFSAFARQLQQLDDPDSTLAEIVRAAIELVPGCDEGSISVVVGRRRVTSQAPSSPLPRLVDAIQEETGQGSCLDAVYEQETVRVPDLAAEQRWPLFTARAQEAGAAGMLSFQLYVEGDNLGALNLFSRTAGAFTDSSEHVGLLLASHAAIAYAAAQRQVKARQTLATRQFIGQAQASSWNATRSPGSRPSRYSHRPVNPATCGYATSRTGSSTAESSPPATSSRRRTTTSTPPASHSHPDRLT